ncbi:MAG: AI-2E family transporter [bacterium]
MISKAKINKFVFDKKGWIPILFFVLFLLTVFLAPTISTILIASLFAAYAIDPLVRVMSDKLKFPRVFASGLAIFFIALLAVLLLLIVLPGIIKQLYGVFTKLDLVAVSLWSWLDSVASDFGINLSEHFKQEELVERFKSFSNPMLSSATKVVGAVFNKTFGFLTLFFSFLIFAVITFFTSSRYPRVKADIFELFPLAKREYIKGWLHKFDKVLSGFIRGQLTVCFVLGCLYAGAFAVAGVPSAGSLGAMIGMLCIVPYVGLFVGIIVAVLLALASGGVAVMLKVLVIFLIIQIFDAILITPNIMGKGVGMNPVFVIIAIFAGAEVGGLLGVLIAVPTFAILKLLGSDILKRYKESTFYNENECEKE